MRFQKVLWIFGVLLTVSIVLADVTTQSIDLWTAAHNIRDYSLDIQRGFFALAREDDPAETMAEMQEQLAIVKELYQTDIQPQITDAAYADEITNLLAAAELAIQDGDALRFAWVRGKLWTQLLTTGYHETLQAVEAGDWQQAERWLPLREYRRATRVSAVLNPAAQALADLQAEAITTDEGMQEIGDDLRDAYFFQFRDALSELEEAANRDYLTRASEWVGQAQGYFNLLESDFIAKQSSNLSNTIQSELDMLEKAVLAGDLATVSANITNIRNNIIGYQPANLSDAEIANRSQLLYIYTDLVYIEYKDGVRDGEILIPVEYQEAQTFRDQAELAFQELRPIIAESNPEDSETLARLLSEMEIIIAEKGDPADIMERVSTAKELIGRNLPFDITNSTAATFEIVKTLLVDIENSVAEGRYIDAEQSQLQAYALFDFGPEQRLQAFNPQLAIRIEGLFWHGDGNEDGLARVIATSGTAEEIHVVAESLGEALDEAEVVLGTASSSPISIIVNASVIVLREGLEAVVIIVALTASMVGANKMYRKPLFYGAVASIIATLLTWVLADRVISLFRDAGERLEAVVSLIALGVLLLITNWFFHRIYWKDHMADQHKRKSLILSQGAGQMIGLFVLGFTAIYREGFETVLFLQALVIDAGIWVVIQGVVLGGVLVAIVGFLTFKLQRRLPYMKMMVFTGILIGGVLLIMVGNTVRVMQVVGWMPIHPIGDLQFPYWWGQWFGVYPTWEGILFQIAAAVFVIGSYFLANYLNKRRRMQRVSQDKNEQLQLSKQV